MARGIVRAGPTATVAAAVVAGRIVRTVPGLCLTTDRAVPLERPLAGRLAVMHHGGLRRVPCVIAAVICTLLRERNGDQHCGDDDGHRDQQDFLAWDALHCLPPRSRSCVAPGCPRAGPNR